VAKLANVRADARGHVYAYDRGCVSHHDGRLSIKSLLLPIWDDPAILRVIVEYKGNHGQTITLKCFYPPTILHHRAIKGAL
jgi:hypothetical protein